MVRPEGLLALVVLVLGIAGCEQVDRDDIVFAVTKTPATLDPRLASDAISERINALLYDRLVELDARGEPRAAMADWQQLGVQRYRVTLRDARATFWRGEQPSAQDVAATYRSLLDPSLASPHAGALAHVSEVAVVDRRRVDFHLSRPDPTFPSRLTIGILPASAVRSVDTVRRPHGSGAFEFVTWRDDGGVVLRRRADGQGLRFDPVADPTMRVLKLLRGEAQLLQNDLPGELYRFLRSHPEIQLSELSGTTFAYLGFNLADPVLAKHDVRAAIAHAIDRDAIIRYLFAGRAEKAGAVLRPQHWAGNPELAGFDYDPARARALLARAGYDEQRPLQLSYKTSTDPFRVRIAHVFQQQLAEVGIQLHIASYDWGTFFGDIKAGNFQLYSLAWVGVNSPDILRYAFHSASRPPGGANRGAYRSPLVDQLIETAEVAERATAARLYADAQQHIHDDIVYVPLWYEANVAAMRDVDQYGPGYDGNYLALNQVRRSHVVAP